MALAKPCRVRLEAMAISKGGPAVQVAVLATEAIRDWAEPEEEVLALARTARMDWVEFPNLAVMGEREDGEVQARVTAQCLAVAVGVQRIQFLDQVPMER